MRLHWNWLIVLVLPLLFAGQAFGKTLEVITTTTDLAALVRAVGGDRVRVQAIAKGTQDPHQIEAKPSYMVRMRNADLVLAHGLDLETAWLVPLIQGARNPKIAVGTQGLFEIGGQLDPLDPAQGPVSRAHGDVHPAGNPHFHLDPDRLGRAAQLTADRLSTLSPVHSELFKKNAEAYKARMDKLSQEWKQRLQKSSVREVITYHKTLVYFLRYFGIRNTLQLEPKPGIPPTAAHLLKVSREAKERQIRLVMVENFYSLTAADKIKQLVPSIVVREAPVAVLGEPDLQTNEQLLERLVKIIENADK